MSPRGGAVLVDRGSFRVDRKKALDKLKEFQLPDASMFLLPWVEAAVEGGAKKIRFTARRMGLEMSFDGKPFTAQELRDPYRCLFEGGAGRSRGRGLAVGLLSALRFKPEQVSVSSVNGKETAILQVKSVEDDSLETAPAEGGGFPVTTVWVGIPAPFDAMLAHVAKSCAHCPATLEIEGADPIAAVPLPEPNAQIRGTGLSGAVWFSPSFLERSRIEMVSHGVTISEETPLLPLAQAEGFVRDDRFRRNISLTAVVKDERFQAALQAAARASRKLLEDNLPFLEKHAAEVGTLLKDPYYRRFWMRWESNAALETLWKTLFKPSGASEEKAALVARASLIAAAARMALTRRAESIREAERGLLKSLLQAPLTFSPEGTPLSLEKLEAQRKILGHVPFTDRWDPRPVSGGTAAWTPRASDLAFLRGIYGDALRPVVKGWTEDLVDVSAVLEEKTLVTVDFEAGSRFGQLGLSPTMRGGGTRVRWLAEGKPPASLTWNLGPLRLEAVLHASKPEPSGDRVADQAAVSEALLAAAPALYRSAAALYNPAQESAAQAYLREHLLDFLLSRAASPENPFPSEDGWLTALKLFRTDAEEMMSLDEIRACADKGDTPSFLASPHPRSLAHLAAGRPERVKELLGKTPWIAGITRRRAPAPPAQAAPGPTPAGAPPAPKIPEVSPEKALAALKAWLHGIEDQASAPRARTLAKELTAASSGTDSKQLVWRHASGVAVNFNHPAVAGLLRTADLAPRLPFLASLIFSAVNRLAGEISDADDIQFQLALAEKTP